MSTSRDESSPPASPKRRRGSASLQLPRTSKVDKNSFAPLLNLQDVMKGMSEVTNEKGGRQPTLRSPVIPPKKTIPIKNRLPRTASELQLQEDTVAAEWRDLAMFHRLVQGMRDRQRAQQQERQLVQMQQRMSTSEGAFNSGILESLFSEDEDDEDEEDADRPEASTRPDPLDDSNHHRACLLQTDRCVENIIQTRRTHIEVSAGSSLSCEDDDDVWGANYHERESSGRRYDRRISNGRVVTHSEAYGQFLTGKPDRPSSAPPPLFPDLAAATEGNAQPLFGPGPALVDNDEDDRSDEVFDLDF
jgi:hypothetical protein